MHYSVERETITPEVLQGADWKKIVSKRHEDFYRRERREAAERRAIAAIQQLTDSPSSPAEKAQQNGKYATNGNKINTRKKPPIPRLPRDDRKIVERIKTCYICRRTGHRADVCYQPPTQRCRRCGEEHPPPPQGEAPSREARCIIFDGAHTTGSHNCKKRFVTKPKKALHRSSPLTITSNRYSALSSDDAQAVDKDFSDENEKTKSTSHRSRARQ
ncbi:hypothetical protein HPB50_021879 [Hyalomma asiaticum]|uniref:Uncharacterized protein n=1 Tax=Hyalomma asiaticum TaxID=266040 RepID=A0ACB7T4I8_HYAAI|nr:hypothetical protein HPB50_021879 [Hyalomma asiaticum]